MIILFHRRTACFHFTFMLAIIFAANKFSLFAHEGHHHPVKAVDTSTGGHCRGFRRHGHR